MCYFHFDLVLTKTFLRRINFWHNLLITKKDIFRALSKIYHWFFFFKNSYQLQNVNYFLKNSWNNGLVARFSFLFQWLQVQNHSSSKVNSAFHLSKVDEMSIRKFWGLSSKKWTVSSSWPLQPRDSWAPFIKRCH